MSPHITLLSQNIQFTVNQIEALKEQKRIQVEEGKMENASETEATTIQIQEYTELELYNNIKETKL